jgi:excinuclease ABC subunit A
VEQIARDKNSVAGGYLSGLRKLEFPKRVGLLEHAPSTITLARVSVNNLQNLTVSIPLNAFVCFTGVSGSGKSSLVLDTLAPAIANALGVASTSSLTSITGHESITRLIQIDSAPIGRSPRANAATYTGIWNDVRRIFAKTKFARQRGFGAGRFSFNTQGGRCEECRGGGVKRMAMNFLPDLEVTCPVCRGRRFNELTLSIHFRGLSIADVLDLTVDAAAEFFVNHEPIRQVLTTLSEVGLGYLALGQPATTLSGGEAQRIKLAAELARPVAGHTLYILDEPTTGLATDDIRRLLTILQRLVDQGHSMIVIEHNLDVIKTADWIIDLGPEGGKGGGQIVAEGPPAKIAACEASHTGRFLRTRIESQSSRRGAEAERK